MTEKPLKYYSVIVEIKDTAIYEIYAESEPHALIIAEHLLRNKETFTKIIPRSRTVTDVKPLYTKDENGQTNKKN